MESMITVRLFALLKDRAGTGEIRIEGNPSTVKTLLGEVSRRHPPLAELIAAGRVLVSVNQEFAGMDAALRDGDEVALMPPFSGGQDEKGMVRIQAEPFSVEEEIERVKAASRSVGAVVSFLGTTRDLSRGKRVARLEFEHYPGMAEKKLSEIRDRAISEFGVIEVSIIHRVGTVPAGGNIVLIVAASGHRDEAFKACRFCIDEIKRITPIWKRETTPEGETWVEEHP